MMNIGKLFTKLYKMALAKLRPEKYARKIGVKAGDGLHIYGSAYKMFSSEPWAVSLGNNVHITDEVRFLTHDGGTVILRWKIPDLEITKSISVGDNVYIGVRALIMLGVHIGSNCIIGAGAVVTRDIPDNSVAAGVPARVVKSLDEYEAKAAAQSLHLGHLVGREKDLALRKRLEMED